MIKVKKPSVTTIKKYLAALTKKKAKYITSERLANIVGIYPERINEDLSYFDPIITMDYTYNLLDLVPQLEEFVNDDSNKKEKEQVKNIVTKKKLSQYESINDFIYKKMSYQGFINMNYVLSDAELRALKRLIAEEQERRKSKK